MAGLLYYIGWGLAIGFVLGPLAYLTVPWLVVQRLGPEYRQRVGDWYLQQSTSALRRAMAVVREHTGMSLVQSRWDDDHGGEKWSIDDEKHSHDIRDRMHALNDRPFGITFEDLNLVTDPLHARLAELGHDAVAAGRAVWVKDETENDAVDVDYRKLTRNHFSLPLEAGLVDLRGAKRLQVGGARARDASESWDNAEKSQAKFYDNMSAAEVIFIAILFGAGAMTVWFVMNYGDSAAPSGVPGGGVNLVLEPIAWQLGVMLPW